MTKARDLAGNTVTGAFDVGSLDIGGTTVIDDSRNFTNVAGGFRTVNGTSVIGSGDISAGASTTFGDVGTYIWGRPANTTHYATNSTASGLYSTVGTSTSECSYRSASGWNYTASATSVAGTWRAMTGTINNGSNAGPGIWVRIS